MTNVGLWAFGVVFCTAQCEACLITVRVCQLLQLQLKNQLKMELQGQN